VLLTGGQQHQRDRGLQQRGAQHGKRTGSSRAEDPGTQGHRQQHHRSQSRPVENNCGR
jgi:hypothetical protein